MERSIEFYREALGLQAGFEGVLEGDWIECVTGLSGVRARCVFLESPDGGLRMELLQYLSHHEPARPETSLPQLPGLRHIAFQVPDMDAFYLRAAADGARFVSEPVEVPFPLPGGQRKRLCYFHDPDGVLLEAAEYRDAE
jgi:catechol 2,3-dioxygenase-like lactoylglutathione lyase family enzyme